MKWWLPLAIGGAILAATVARARVAPASTSRRVQTRRARTEPASPQERREIAAVWRRWKEQLRKYPSPIPPGALAVRIRRESGGRPDAYVLGKVPGGSEWGLTQLSAPWRRAERTGARASDVDPLDPMGAIWGAQWQAQHTRDKLKAELPGLGKDVPPDSNVPAWIILMAIRHSVGLGGTKSIMRRHPDVRDPVEALRREKQNPQAIGRMSGDLIAWRIKRALTIPELAAELEPLPDQIGPLPPRGSDVPRFNVARLKAIDPRYEG